MNKSESTSIRWLPIALFVALVAAAIRLMFIDQGLWADEVQSVEVSGLGIEELLTRTGLLDVHPPLYYILLKGWNVLGESSDLWSRLFSLVIGSATVGIFLFWAKRHLGGIALAFAVGLLALSSWHVHYSVEVRSYALLAFFVTLLAWHVERWVDSPSSRPYDLAIIVLLTVMTGLTHYYGLFCLVGVNAYVLTHNRVQGNRLKRWATWQAASIACLAWWLPFFFVQAFDLPEGFTSHLQEGPSITELVSVFGPAAAGPTSIAFLAGAGILILSLFGMRELNSHDTEQTPSQDSEPGLQWARLIAGLGLVFPLLAPTLIPDPALKAGHRVLDIYLSHGFDIVSARLPMTYALVGLGWLLLFGATRIPHKLPRHAYRSVAPFVIGSVLLIGGTLHLVQPSLSTRNLLVLLPMVALLAGRTLIRFNLPIKAMATTLMIVLATLSLTESKENFSPRADFSGPAGLISEHTQDTTPQVFVISAFDNGALSRYLKPIPSQGIMSPSQLQGLRRAPLYLLLTREAHADAERFKEAFSKTLSWGFQLDESHAFRQVQLLVFKPR